MNPVDGVDASMARSFEVRLSDFVIDVIARDAPRDSPQVRGRFSQAIRFYLHEASLRRPGWSVPSALRGEQEGDEMRLELDDELLCRLEAEARKQDASLSRLVSQAAIYYAAELDAGRITQRVFDDLGKDD
ncbi:MAG TPA: hypothetical protein VJ989_04075 [Solirubrobacterales bacterium]|nr:hypothetical protein [Solirubrobacterales bacterium]